MHKSNVHLQKQNQTTTKTHAMDPVEGSPDDDKQWRRWECAGVRHIDSGSDDSDIDVEPLVDPAKITR
jgi:hypothetical protein